MPNFERDDNSTDSCFPPRSAPHQTIDRCAGCHAEIDTTDDPLPRCPLCGSLDWFRMTVLPSICLLGNGSCCGPRASVTQHVCTGCLALVAIHERCSSDALFCMCPACKSSQQAPPRAQRSATSRAEKPDNPFDSDDWL